MQLCKDKQNTSQIVVVVGLMLLRSIDFLPVYKLVLLASGSGQEGQQDGWSRAGKKSQLRLSATGIFFNLFPQGKVFLVLLPLRVMPAHS